MKVEADQSEKLKISLLPHFTGQCKHNSVQSQGEGNRFHLYCGRNRKEFAANLNIQLLLMVFLIPNFSENNAVFILCGISVTAIFRSFSFHDSTLFWFSWYLWSYSHLLVKNPLLFLTLKILFLRIPSLVLFCYHFIFFYLSYWTF